MLIFKGAERGEARVNETACNTVLLYVQKNVQIKEKEFR